MKSSWFLLAVLLSIAPIALANATPRHRADQVAASTPQPVANLAMQCSWSNGQISPVPCHKRYAKNYEACRKYVIEHGETAASASWYCTSQGYTN